jgi:NAD/NADP transhydrogenase alpha subunit
MVKLKNKSQWPLSGLGVGSSPRGRKGEMGKAETNNYLALILGFLAVVLGTLNVVGGFVVTDRMLEMFKKKKSP